MGDPLAEAMGFGDTDAEDWDRTFAFADPGGDSALRRATPSNPRDCDCPTCGTANVLTRADVAAGYQCNRCARLEEGP